MSKIHPTAVVEDGARLGQNVSVGACAFIGRHVTVGDGSVVHNHATLDGHTTIGRHNQLYPYSSVGTPPQDLSWTPEQDTYLVMGDSNVIREFVTINCGTIKEPERTTRVGSHCLIMATSHIAHDCVVGDHFIMANGCMLGGHVRIGHHVVFGGMVGVHHFTSLGDYAFVGGWSRVRQDVPPFLVSDGVPLEVKNINHVGLRRGGMTEATVAEIKRAFRALYRSDQMLSIAIRTFEQENANLCAELKYLLQFLKNKMEGPNGRYLESLLRK